MLLVQYFLETKSRSNKSKLQMNQIDRSREKSWYSFYYDYNEKLYELCLLDDAKALKGIHRFSNWRGCCWQLCLSFTLSGMCRAVFYYYGTDFFTNSYPSKFGSKAATTQSLRRLNMSFSSEHTLNYFPRPSRLKSYYCTSAAIITITSVRESRKERYHKDTIQSKLNLLRFPKR